MIPNLFIQNTVDVLDETNNGMPSLEIVKLCSAYAVDYNNGIPYTSLPFQLMGLFLISEQY